MAAEAPLLLTPSEEELARQRRLNWELLSVMGDFFTRSPEDGMELYAEDTSTAEFSRRLSTPTFEPALLDSKRILDLHEETALVKSETQHYLYDDGVSPLTESFKAFGTSMPKAGFFDFSAPSGSRRRNHWTRFTPGTQGSVPYPSFASARSSLASYATAPSVPRQLRTLSSLREETTDGPRDASGDENDTSSLSDAQFERLVHSAEMAVKDYVPYFGTDPGYSSRTLFLQSIRRQLFPVRLQHGVSGEAVVRGVMAEVLLFFNKRRRMTTGSYTDWQAALHYQLLCMISEFSLDRLPVTSPAFSSEWLQHLSSRGIILDVSQALDWSGRGQHVEYSPDEEASIPLRVEKTLGHSATAIVHSVMCRRIRLARKTIKCDRRLKKETAVTEVEHLQRLQHRHIIRVVGTYTLRKTLAILLYPVAQCNLEEFLDEVVESRLSRHDNAVARTLSGFIGCLASALDYLHNQNVKHMDIKPQNLLVCQGWTDKIYIADFGIARAYTCAEESFTDTPTSFTRTYAAPEVVSQDTRGFPADVFSLGCVFMELLATIASTQSHSELEVLQDIRHQAEDRSYQANIERVLTWHKVLMLERLSGNRTIASIFNNSCPALAADMMSHGPEKRPHAAVLKQQTQHLCCGSCDSGPDQFEAAERQDEA